MKKVMIVFPDPHLAYSPTTLNLYDSLADNDFDVSILTFEPDPNYSTQRIESKKVKYIVRPNENNLKPLSIVQRIINRIKITLDPRLKKLYDPLLSKAARALINEIKQFEGEIIAADFFALWCVQQAGGSAHLISLEILEADRYRPACDTSTIKSVVIQSKSRLDYLFKENELTYFIIQNAPKFIDTKINTDLRDPFRLIFCGSAMPWFGIYSCIEFISDYPQYTLTVKGAVPLFVKGVIIENFSHLIETKRLIIDEAYLGETELNDYLKNFYIGFVFYDKFRFDFINTFNYRTVPSGKLFQYYNAGVPVICNNLEGLNSVESINTGISINTMSSLQIKHAIEKIEHDYEAMSMNAKQASKDVDFSKNVKPFIEFLLKK